MILEGYDSTNHSYQSVRGGGRFINWSAQPRAYKIYPKFFVRVPFERLGTKAAFLKELAAINFEKKISAYESYQLRSIPSAGALYPNEIYLQVRGVEGLEDGVYHYESFSSSLVFLAPVSASYGLEFFLSDTRLVKGFLFFISAAYFRSSWKYGDRAIRYCYLDAGHILGALEAVTSQQAATSCTLGGSFDAGGVGEFLGFEDKEWAICTAVLGERGDRAAARPPFKLPFVSPYDYFENSEFVFSWLKEEGGFESIGGYRYECDELKTAIKERRSVRAFYGKEIAKEQFLKVSGAFTADFLDVWCAVHRVDGYENGLYLNGSLQKSGDFRDKCGYLCLEQALGRESAFTIFLTTRQSDIKSALLEAGVLAHRVYLEAGCVGLGVSGIGAYYDSEVEEFLGSECRVLYAVAVGV